jgi:gliding motility-associated lipoprotein GldH
LKTLFRISYIVLFTSYLLSSCTTVDLYEKTVTIPGHSWKSSFKPSFTFSIKDTSSTYELYVIVRHNDKYSFNNLYLNLYYKAPGQPENKVTLDLPLATNEKGWLASGMDDIYEHRIDINKELVNSNFSLRRSGDYTFTLEQIMREDPLNNMLNMGIRLEKKQ